MICFSNLYVTDTECSRHIHDSRHEIWEKKIERWHLTPEPDGGEFKGCSLQYSSHDLDVDIWKEYNLLNHIKSQTRIIFGILRTSFATELNVNDVKDNVV